ncbi:hypothetical protein ABID82_005027 [Methylobacterium sp. PvP062]|uniref:Uncharacterized protein n=1 Tax=Methylobacterium radiotolerans TaxID=31998 RepID=A0ABV2NP51_9HYPH|nr:MULTISPECIES: hypothetical protein [unclassified Methylobacterium]MBP2494988.1 hypothetical protein [Methylobacterium sp. PvP105]MBP2505141.1 hypothetical protein [Methylobacterium sp. PvP109]MCX7336510.1 hypothetical protein [Hyphomicrobiales bacterium]
MSNEKMKLPSGEQSWSKTETTIAQAAIEEPADDTLLRPARRGVGRVVRAEMVHHYRRALVVHIRPSRLDVALTQSFHRFDRRAPFQEATTIGMSPGEARRIGELLIAAADEADAVNETSEAPTPAARAEGCAQIVGPDERVAGVEIANAVLRQVEG